MKLTQRIPTRRLTLSFEVFPPKTDTGFSSVESAALQIASHAPLFMSVTYGAGGSGSKYTFGLAGRIEQNTGVPVLAHLTCIGQTRESIARALEQLHALGICNIMALRGDLPENQEHAGEFRHAVDLVEYIRSGWPEFCIGGACYPEIHPESPSRKEDIAYLKEKADAGCDFLTSQMFFDNTLFFHFLYRIREAGIHIPVFPGIMPITNASQIDRALRLSGSFIPTRFKTLVDRFGSNPAAMKQAGIAYATDQIIDLYASGIDNVHVYTMNKPDVAAALCRNLSDILGSES